MAGANDRRGSDCRQQRGESHGINDVRMSPLVRRKGRKKAPELVLRGDKPAEVILD